MNMKKVKLLCLTVAFCCFIVGCGGGHIDKLEIGESKTVWVDITGDCSIDINYLSDGKQKEESVAAYVTNSMGQKMKHNIGELNDRKF